MTVRVVEHHAGGRTRVFSGGDDEVRDDLLAAYPWLATKFGRQAPVSVLCVALGRSQAYEVFLSARSEEIFTKSQGAVGGMLHAMLGYDHANEVALAAAAFLTQAEPDRGAFRRGLAVYGGDEVRAALFACGAADPDDPVIVRAMRAVMKTSNPDFYKAEAALPEPVKLQDVTNATEDGRAVAEAVSRASEAGEVRPVKLGGKHSLGALMARDAEGGGHWLLKPGSGPASPAAGVAEVAASQSKREAAFCAVARLWGLGEFFPETHLLLVGGKEYSASRFEGAGYRTMNDWRRAGDDPRRPLALLLPGGSLHKLAALDYVLGNIDSHGGNALIRKSDGDLKLIDHGSAFAGDDFAPATDPDTFVPAYLTAFAPLDFTKLTSGEKLAALPRLGRDAASALKVWLIGLSEVDTAAAIHRLGVEAEPCARRLDKLVSDARTMPADLAVNAAWVV